jgi:hypothetical protein
LAPQRRAAGAVAAAALAALLHRHHAAKRPMDPARPHLHSNILAEVAANCNISIYSLFQGRVLLGLHAVHQIHGQLQADNEYLALPLRVKLPLCSVLKSLLLGAPVAPDIVVYSESAESI